MKTIAPLLRHGRTALAVPPASAFTSVFLLTVFLGCASTPAPQAGAETGSGTRSTGGAPGLFRGDRLIVDREYLYLDDPLFLQRKSVYAYREAGFFTFQIPIYFNASRDTLRFGSRGFRIRTSAPESEPLSCMAYTGPSLADSAAVSMLFLDTARTLVFPPGQGASRRVQLNIHCRGYDPPRGRIDTLSLAFNRSNGTEGNRDVTFDLPFHVSYRGPVVSILLGVGLLYLFTQAGLWISEF